MRLDYLTLARCKFGYKRGWMMKSETKLIFITILGVVFNAISVLAADVPVSWTIGNEAPYTVNAGNVLDADGSCGGDSWDTGGDTGGVFSTHILNFTINYK